MAYTAPSSDRCVKCGAQLASVTLSMFCNPCRQAFLEAVWRKVWEEDGVKVELFVRKTLRVEAPHGDVRRN